MSLIINTNVSSLNAQRNLMNSQASMQTSLQRLSSGLRINSAKDDAAGLAISERMTSQIRGLQQGLRNANDGISMAQTAEGALGEVTNALQRMRELAVQAANDTSSTDDKAALDAEYQALSEEITRITTATEFNGTAVIGGAASLEFQVGYKSGADQIITVDTVDVAAETNVALALAGDITDKANANTAMTNIDNALTEVSTVRADFGAAQNRLESTVRNTANIIENQSAARSRIRDADFAAETANLTRTQILQQAGTAMLAQANQVPQIALSLLR
ncbi:MAG: flagellin [Sedimenticolaceae bacterium]|jgi:flagellin